MVKNVLFPAKKTAHKNILRFALTTNWFTMPNIDSKEKSMVKVNRISRGTNRKTTAGILLILAAAAVGTVIWGKKTPPALQGVLSADGRSCELQPITAVSADGCRLRLKMSLEPQNRTETGRNLALEKQIAANIAAGLRQYPCRDLSPGADPRILHGELRKQIDRAIAPAKIKNIRFSRLSE